MHTDSTPTYGLQSDATTNVKTEIPEYFLNITRAIPFRGGFSKPLIFPGTVAKMNRAVNNKCHFSTNSGPMGV